MAADGIRLKFNEQKIHQSMLEALYTQINKAAKALVNDGQILSMIKSLITKNILSSPEANSLISGELRGFFGIENPDGIVGNIALAVANSTNLNIKSSKSSFKDFEIILEINISKADFSDAMAVSGTAFASEKGILIDWLRWLLFRGDDIIITGYTLKSDPDNSRTGTFITVPDPTSTLRVPSAYSGTQDNNFITRSLDGIDRELRKILETGMKKYANI